MGDSVPSTKPPPSSSKSACLRSMGPWPAPSGGASELPGRGQHQVGREARPSSLSALGHSLSVIPPSARCLHTHWRRATAVDGLSSHGSLLRVRGPLVAAAQVVSPRGRPGPGRAHSLTGDTCCRHSQRSRKWPSMCLCNDFSTSSQRFAA